MFDQTSYTWADLDRVNRANNHYSSKSLPAYLAEAKGNAIACERALIRACDELETLTGNEEREDFQAIYAKIDAAHALCDAADQRLMDACARYNLEQAEKLAAVRATCAHAHTELTGWGSHDDVSEELVCTDCGAVLPRSILRLDADDEITPELSPSPADCLMETTDAKNLCSERVAV